MLLIGQCLAWSAIGVPVAAGLINRYSFKGNCRLPTAGLACLISYGLLLASLPFAEAGLDAEMMSFDLDGDGSFDQSEISPDAEAAMERWQSDVGRNFAPCTGLVLVPIWTAAVFWILSPRTWTFFGPRRSLSNE